MTLRNRFRLLLLIFGASVVTNVLVSVWCIHIYMAQATARFATLLVGIQEAQRAARLVDELVTDLGRRPGRERPWRDTRYRGLLRAIAEAMPVLARVENGAEDGAPRPRLAALADALSQTSEQYVELVDADRQAEAADLLASTLIPQCAEPLQAHLARLATDTNEVMTRTSAQVERKAVSVSLLLAGNAVVAFVLAAAGVHLVRNWVLRPVAALKEAAEQHASGNLQHRIEPVGGDELGTLSREINRMAEALLVNQRRLVEQERLAAVGEITSMVAHNIRNPLAGIRASAQASMDDLPEASEVRRRLMTTVETVDSLNRWLRELLMVGQPLSLNCESACLRQVVDRVLAVIQSNGNRKTVRFEVAAPPTGCLAYVDAPRVEQAVLTLVDNAVDASPPEAVVRIELEPGGADGWAELRVVDRGGGIAPEVIERIARPYVSGKPGGTGLGLYLAKRTIQAHGGTLEFQNNHDGGTTVIARLPAAGAPDRLKTCPTGG